MKRISKKFLSGTMLFALALPLSAMADDQALQQKIDDLTKKVDKLESKSIGQWLSIGGDYRFRVDSIIENMPAYSSAIGTMSYMVNGLVNGYNAGAMGFIPGVAGTSVGASANPIVNPSAASFIMMGKSGSLFTPTQFDTILNKYMPSAMYNAITSPSGLMSAANPLVGMYAPTATAAAVKGALAATALTPQQAQILATLEKKGLLTAVQSQLPAPLLAALGGMTQDQYQLFKQQLMQGFLGQPSAQNPTTFLQQQQAYKPSNDTLYTNRFGLDLHGKATKDVTVNVRLLAYKSFGMGDVNSGDPAFADRVGVFDGTIGHVPSSDFLAVDRAYVTWANIAELPVWYSVGRRPATNGVPSHLRLNNETPGNGGTPALLVDYAFDGMTLGWAPDFDMFPGAYAKLCYGRAFESGIDSPGAKALRDTDMIGIAVVPYDTDLLRISTQWNRGMNIFDFPVMQNTFVGNTGVSKELGSIDWFELGALSTLKNIGPGTLSMFGTVGMSVSHPNGNVSDNAGFQGLMTGQFFAQEDPTDKKGFGGYFGARYDYNPSKTKVGLEYNHGTKNWITFVPSADDMVTGKVGTRGNVYEGYLIQELDLKPISSHLSKAFFRLGYQYYDFQYTGSNNWVGAPQKISDIKSTDMFMLTPLKSAQNLYATFEVKF